MTKQEQIEEMTKIMCKECVEATAMTCRFTKEEVPCDFAKCFGEALYNAGYRKSDEIQLECENASLTVENEVLKRDVQNLERTLEESKEELERVCKETAKEILQTLYNYPHEYHESKIKELAKQYGVEVKE